MPAVYLGNTGHIPTPQIVELHATNRMAGTGSAGSSQIAPYPVDGMERDPQVSINMQNASWQDIRRDFNQPYDIVSVDVGYSGSVGSRAFNLSGNNVLTIPPGSGVAHWEGRVTASSWYVFDPSGGRLTITSLRIYAEILV